MKIKFYNFDSEKIVEESGCVDYFLNEDKATKMNCPKP